MSFDQRMPIHGSITEVALLDALDRREDYPGFCKICGHEHSNIEPDARDYKCELCGEQAVDGIEELLFAMGIA